MSSRARSIVVLGLFVIGIPALCLGGVLFFGKALSDAEVSSGTLLSPEEARARTAELARRFAAMTSAQHLAAAEEALACGFQASTRTGGNFLLATQHLRAIGEAAPERARALTLLAEAAQREERTLAEQRRRLESAIDGVARRIAAEARSAGDLSRVDRDDLRELREKLAHTLDQEFARELGCIHADHEASTSLSFNRAGCDGAMLERLGPPALRPTLRSFGFVALRCGVDAIDLRSAR